MSIFGGMHLQALRAMRCYRSQLCGAQERLGGRRSYICCSTFETDEYLQQRNGLSMLSCSHKMDEMIARGSFLLPTPWAQPPVTLETARAQCNLFCPMTNLKLAGSCT